MRSALFLLLVFVAAVLGQFTTNPGNYQRRQNLDTFTLGSQFLSLVTTSSTTYPNQQSSVFVNPTADDEDLIGGERDLLLFVETGTSSKTISTNVGQGIWSVDTSQGLSGFVQIQLDGTDGSTQLNLPGFGASDLTLGGSAQAVNVTLRTDVPSEFRFFFYNANGNQCDTAVDIPISSTFVNYYFPFSQIDGNCNFAAITAIEIEIEAFNNVDAAVTFFGTVGEPVSPSRSPTPSRSPAPTVTRTPTSSPIPSGTRTPTPSSTPTRTPTPAPSQDCMCHCPIFTCALIFDPDDDQNQVYYFDDDDDENNGVQGGSLQDAATASTASSITVSFVAVVVAVVAFLY